jgi:hypothetical protein
MKNLVFIPLLFSSVVLPYKGQNEIYSNYTVTEFTPLIELSHGRISDEWTPILVWGSKKSSEKISRNEYAFSVLYTSDIPVNELFSILSLELAINGRVFYVAGNRLTDDIMRHIRELPTETMVYCTAKYHGESGLIRIIHGNWMVI